MEIHLTTAELDLQLPILPPSFEVSDPQQNETVTVHTVGEVNLLGKRGLRTISIASLFPNSDYEWQNAKSQMKPYKYINQLKKWKNAGTILELTITDTNINFNVTIESLVYSEDDVSGDVSYTIELKEYVSLTRLNKQTVASTSSKKNTYKVKKGDTLKKIAKKKLGSSSYSKLLYKTNKKVIEAAVKKYVKKYNKTAKKYNKTHAKKKKLLKWKNSKKGARLIVGTVLTIPKKPKSKKKAKKTKKVKSSKKSKKK